MIFLSLITAAFASHSCPDCAALEKIVKAYRAQTSVEKPAYAKLEGEAVLVVERMTKKSKVLTPEQLDSYFEVMRYAIPNDPGEVFADDTIDVIKANLPALSLKIKKLPAREASELSKAIDVYLAKDEYGPDRN